MELLQTDLTYQVVLFLRQLSIEMQVWNSSLYSEIMVLIMRWSHKDSAVSLHLHLKLVPCTMLTVQDSSIWVLVLTFQTGLVLCP